MKTKGILHNDLAREVARLGHGDMLVITDRGFPFPRHENTICIDVSVGRDLPRFVDVVKVVLEELEIEKVIIADETKSVSPEIYSQLKDIVSQIKNKGNDIVEENIPHPEFKDLVLNGSLQGKEVKVFVKTGEFTPYANIILVSGVDF
ncbi:MAG TPA: D-ribose pyranase [Mesotoga sp.]|uniref:D-ribose pyranase n=1 Tax=Mesotoga sp. TaxID=2053577 RepID=UPI002D02A649|nr:D-ribose pyranase [Mesotoga sp.]